MIPQKDRHLAVASGAVQCAATTVETSDDDVAESITGQLIAAGETDVYSFAGMAGQKFTFEVMSRTLHRIGTAGFDTVLRIKDAWHRLPSYPDEVSGWAAE